MNDAPKPDGGPAFPVQHCGDIAPTKGMTLRDWFAGQALSQLIADGHTRTRLTVSNEALEEYAKASYKMADAMLAAREGRSQ